MPTYIPTEIMFEDYYIKWKYSYTQSFLSSQHYEYHKIPILIFTLLFIV